MTDEIRYWLKKINQGRKELLQMEVHVAALIAKEGDINDRVSKEDQSSSNYE